MLTSEYDPVASLPDEQSAGVNAGPARRLTRRQTLQTRIGISLGLLIIGFALALAALLAGAAEQQVLRLNAANLEALSEQMARELSDGMDRFGRDVVNESTRERFADPALGPAALRAALEQFQRSNPEFSYLSVVDAASGRMIAATGGIFEGGDARGRPVFDEGRKGLFLGDVHPAVRLAELMPRPSNGEALRFLDAAAPIRNAAGDVVRVLATHVGWQWADTLRLRVFGPIKHRRGVEAFLVDSAGKVVLAGAPDLPVGAELAWAMGHEGGASTRRWADGQKYLTFVAATGPQGAFRVFGWRVVARQPYAAATAPVQKLRVAFVTGALAIGLAGAVLAWWVAGRLVRPVRELAAAAASPEPGDAMRQLAPDARSIGEVSDVHRAIMRLADEARVHALATTTSRRQFTALADVLPQAVWQADAAGGIVYVNQTWIRRHKPTGAFAITDIEALLQAPDRSTFAQAWARSAATGDPLSARCRVLNAEGTMARWFDIEALAIPGEEGRVSGWVGTLLDVHEMVLLAQQTSRSLEEERAARAEAERLAQMRDQFLATVSHELRSPLSAIKGWSDILIRKGNGDPMLVKASGVIRRNVKIQEGLINDLLDMSAAMGGKLAVNRVPVDLAVLASKAVASHLHAAQLKGVALVGDIHGPVVVAADARRMGQVLSNLIGNAIKFTDAGGTITLQAGNEGGQAVARVRDTGRGISAAFLPHVFDRMRQEDPTVTRRSGGLGLGLAISRVLVELHEGRIEAASEGPGCGACFTVTMSLAEAGLGADGPPGHDHDAETAVDLQGARILLVDDEPDAREVAQVALSSLGADVRMASSGAEVLQLLQRERFDVLVSDIGMPEMDGLTLLRRVRKLPQGSATQLPAVALTAFALESDRQQGAQAGFQAYVAKPISLHALAHAIVAARRG